jgi:uncharacterized protein
MKTMKQIFFALSMFCACASFAQYGLIEGNLKTVTVTGYAKVNESPDKIVIEVTLSDEYCAGPKENIDALTQLYADALTKAAIDKAKSKLLKEDRFDLGYTTARKTSEMISRTYRLELANIKQYDVFCQSISSKGVSISVLEISNSKINELKQKAQREAIIAARDKATNYVVVAGGKLGSVLRIDENTENYQPSQSNPGGEVAEGVVFPIIINDYIEYEVQVVFQLN